LEYFKNKFTADKLNVYARADPNIVDLVQGEHPKSTVEYGWGHEHKKTCNNSETVQDGTKVTMTD